MLEQIPSKLVWARIGTEANMPLEDILRFKEWDRQLGENHFGWGIRNPPVAYEKVLLTRQAGLRAPVLFSEVSTSESIAHPKKRRLWLAYWDPRDERIRPLPNASFIVSDDATGKDPNIYYCLFCFSETPLALIGVEFPHWRYKPIGRKTRTAGQKNCLAMERKKEPIPDSEIEPLKYDSGFWAYLAPPYRAKLARGIPLLHSENEELDALLTDRSTTKNEWRDFVARVKTDAKQRTPFP